ncbi:MAG: lysophospholipase [Myxococcota bacterium]|jgi:alpha-beta hydrolase superfamily lysophospholipase
MARHDEGYFSSKDGTRLFWRSAAPDGEATAMVAVVHGYGDHSGRYTRTMDDLAARGFSTLAVDYRGHGKADGKRADCQKWTDYLDDMAVFWRRVREAAGALPTFVLAHSHGALIATHWAASKPEGLKGLVLSAPYYKLALAVPPLKLFGAKLIKGLMPGFQIGNELKPDQLSRDPAWQKATAEDPLYLHVTTPRWFFEHTAAQDRLAGLGSAITQPLLMLAGSADPIASMPAAKAFFETVASKDKTWKEYIDFRHEVMNEVGREQVLDDISRWISAHR